MSDNTGPVWYFAVPSPINGEEGRWLVFVRRDEAKGWWRLVARFEDEVRALDYVDYVNALIANEWREVLRDGEGPVSVGESVTTAFQKVVGEATKSEATISATPWLPEEVEFVRSRAHEMPSALLKLLPGKTLNQIKSKLKTVRKEVARRAEQDEVSAVPEAVPDTPPLKQSRRSIARLVRRRAGPSVPWLPREEELDAMERFEREIGVTRIEVTEVADDVVPMTHSDRRPGVMG